MVDRLAEGVAVGQERRDIPEEDAGLGEVGDFSDPTLQVVYAHGVPPFTGWVEY
jgi:hypothetical protein